MYIFISVCVSVSVPARENKSLDLETPVISHLHGLRAKALLCYINKPQQHVGVSCCKKVRMG